MPDLTPVQTLLSLKGPTALVIGGSRGMGLRGVQTLAAGAQVIDAERRGLMNAQIWNLRNAGHDVHGLQRIGCEGKSVIQPYAQLNALGLYAGIIVSYAALSGGGKLCDNAQTH